MAEEERLIKAPGWFRKPDSRFPDLMSVVRKQYTSLEEAQEYTRSLQVNAAYGSSLTIANILVEVLAQLIERNLPLPRSVSVNARHFRHLANLLPLVVAKEEAGNLFINPEADYWADPVGYMREVYAVRIWSTPHPLHPIYHEIGHFVQKSRNTKGKSLPPDALTEAQGVSERAKDGRDEFVAEVFAGLYSGVEYDSEIMRYYKRYGGRIP